ncbi:MAG: SUMF1/EgtB/PvdO family nonheme iron enzyme [Planctomycetes bacterium]|nr:SUMF1/EgtB/PvdO family nonheme iron enzyme [Planctomycetota bacterium]
MHKKHRDMYGGRVRYTLAYESLIPYIRRLNFGDDVSLLDPGYYHADTSELIQMLQAGHHGVELEPEAWDRLVTWIDLNGPCHGTWQDVFNGDIPTGHHIRRQELAQKYSTGSYINNVVPQTRLYDETPVRVSAPVKKTQPLSKTKFKDNQPWNYEFITIDLGQGKSLRMVKVPASPPFWMAVCEVSNEQYNQFDPQHDNRHYGRRRLEDSDGKGIPLNQPQQPVMRVSWDDAMDFCEWLSKKSGLSITLPSEEQWQLACRAGSHTAFHYGGCNDDFSAYANMADKSFANLGVRKKDLHFELAGESYLAAEGVKLAERRFDDGEVVTSSVGRYQSNSLGLYDMHGNAAEWTLTDDGGEKVVKGGSFLDRPSRCAANHNISYPQWQKVYNVGFRVVINSD